MTIWAWVPIALTAVGVVFLISVGRFRALYVKVP